MLRGKCDAISSNKVYYWSLIFMFHIVITATNGILERKQHQTNASLESKNDLTCFECNSINAGIKCYNLSLHNKTEFRKRCKGDKKKCMVKKYSYTTSTENSTSRMRIWSVERSCASRCEEGCIVIGERTKLHACTACCTESLCNVTSGSECKYFLSWICVYFSFINAIFILFRLIIVKNF